MAQRIGARLVMDDVVSGPMQHDYGNVQNGMHSNRIPCSFIWLHHGWKLLVVGSGHRETAALKFIVTYVAEIQN